MPTKRNGSGEQQPYIPKGSGDPSGEYADASGNNAHATIEDTDESKALEKRQGLDELVKRLLKNKKEAKADDETNRAFTHMPLDVWEKASAEQKRQLIDWNEKTKPNIDDVLKQSLDEREKAEKERNDQRVKFASELLGIDAEDIKKAQQQEAEANQKMKEERREKSQALSSFENWMFKDFAYHGSSNSKKRYFDRVSKDGDKIIVRVGSAHLFPTQYGYGLRLDRTHVVFLKPWAVNKNWFGNEVYLDKKYFSPKQWGSPNEDFPDDDEALNFDYWKKSAEAQDKAGNGAIWDKKARRDD